MPSNRETSRFFAVGIGVGIAVALTVYLRRLIESPEGERQIRAMQGATQSPHSRRWPCGQCPSSGEACPG